MSRKTTRVEEFIAVAMVAWGAVAVLVIVVLSFVGGNGS